MTEQAMPGEAVSREAMPDEMLDKYRGGNHD